MRSVVGRTLQLGDSVADQCKDCGSKTRKLSPPGPRCFTCHREKKKRDKLRARDRHYQKTYGITLQDYEDTLAFQGNVCYICQRATGATKALALDHSHVTGEPRGVLCGPDNQMLGQARDDPEFFRRAIEYLENPPYKRMKESKNND